MSSKNTHEGRYVYCIVNSGKETDFGHMGIENSFVYTLPIKDIGAIVHRGEAKLYKTEDKEKAAEWLLTHQYVIDLATKEFGTVIPLAFSNIFAGDDEAVKKWLNEHYSQLKTLLEWLEGKEQYEVQIFLENEFVRKTIEENEEIQNLRKEMENKTKGAAYLLKKQQEKKQQEKRLALIEHHTENLYNQIKEFVDDVKNEPTNKKVPEKWERKLMILNLSCLVRKDRVQKLTTLLEEVNRREGFAVRFTGPWPPYSFVAEIGGSKGRQEVK
ncbi:MAG: gas vesicle protein GvpL [Candidatus Micrarchaeota archaeon]